MSDKDKIYEIGEVFQWGDVWLKVEEETATDSHIGCYFLDKRGNCSDSSGHPPCGAVNRDVKKVGVIFVAVPEPEKELAEVNALAEELRQMSHQLALDTRETQDRLEKELADSQTRHGKTISDLHSEARDAMELRKQLESQVRLADKEFDAGRLLKKELAEATLKLEQLPRWKDASWLASEQSLMKVNRKLMEECRGIRAEFAAKVQELMPTYDASIGISQPAWQAAEAVRDTCDKLLAYLDSPEPADTEAVADMEAVNNSNLKLIAEKQEMENERDFARDQLQEAEARGVAKRTAEVVEFLEEYRPTDEQCCARNSDEYVANQGKQELADDILAKFAPEPEPTMNHHEAMLAVFAGERVRRTRWDKGVYVFMEDEIFQLADYAGGIRDYVISKSEVDATDWIIAKEAADE